MPLDKEIKITAGDKTDFEPLPKDVYPFELIDIELTSEPGYQTDAIEDKLKFEFACLDEAFYGRRIWKRCTLKVVGGSKPSNLFTLLVGVLNRQLTADELKNPESVFSTDFLNALIGKQIRLSLGQKASEKDASKISNTIESFLPAKEQLAPFDREKSKALGEKAKAGGSAAAPEQIQY